MKIFRRKIFLNMTVFINSCSQARYAADDASVACRVPSSPTNNSAIFLTTNVGGVDPDAPLNHRNGDPHDAVFSLLFL